jgi:hypothetical protein
MILDESPTVTAGAAAAAGDESMLHKAPTAAPGAAAAAREEAMPLGAEGDVGGDEDEAATLDVAFAADAVVDLDHGGTAVEGGKTAA